MSTQTQHAEKASRPQSRGVVRSAVTLVVAWAVILGLVVGFGWLITHALRSAVNPWDNDISRWFADQRTGSLDPLGDYGTLLGETVTGVSVAILAAIGFSLWRRSWRPALFMATARGGHRRLPLRGHPRGHAPAAAGEDPRPRGPAPATASPPATSPRRSSPGGILVLTWVSPRSAVRWVAVPGLLPLFVLLARLPPGRPPDLTDGLTSVVYASAWMLVVARTVLLPDRDRLGGRLTRPSGHPAGCYGWPHDRRLQHLPDHRRRDRRGLRGGRRRRAGGPGVRAAQRDERDVHQRRGGVGRGDGGGQAAPSTWSPRPRPGSGWCSRPTSGPGTTASSPPRSSGSSAPCPTETAVPGYPGETPVTGVPEAAAAS